MNVFEKLISRPRLQPQVQRTLFSAITLLAWTIYLYFWAPLATLLLWLAGFRTSYLQLYLQRNAVNIELLLQLLGIAAFCALVLIGWAEYNRIRFQGFDRRARPADATLEEMALALRASLADAQHLQSARVATIMMADDATPIAVRCAQHLPDTPATPITPELQPA